MDAELVARRTGDGLQLMLRRLAAFVSRVALVALVISVATFATGWWVFDGSTGWLVIGGLLCLAPVAAALFAWFLLRSTARHAPELTENVRRFAETSARSARVLLDADTGQPIGGYVKSFGSLRGELSDRRKELPALFAGIRALTSVPGLAAITVLGMIAIGGLGTILLIGGLID